MDTEGLSIICAGLGVQEEEENGAITGYTPSEYCLDNLKDLQRFLRRDDPQRRDVFKQICKWRTVAQDLTPIIEYHQTDRNLVINAVKVMVFMTMPVDPTSDDVAQQIEYLWELKAAMARNVMIAVIVSLLEDPLEHLEQNAFTEDDWKLVQLLLTLFRNILAIQDITLQQKASGSATQFLFLTDRYLELMFQENVMDLILVLSQHVDDPRGYLRQDNLLLLEIFHYTFQGRDAVLIAEASRKGFKVGGIMTSVESLKHIMEEEEEKRRLIKQRNLERHSQFSGTFTRLALDGSKTLFKGNPASASGEAFIKCHKVPRGRLKRTAWDHGTLFLPREDILESLHNFLNQFLSGGYNVLMQSILEDIRKEHPNIQNSDVVVFFHVAQFAIAYQHQKVFIMQKLSKEVPTPEASADFGLSNNLSLLGDLCGPVAATVSEAMFDVVLSKWREAFEGLKVTNDRKYVSAASSLMKNMIRMLDLVLKLLPEDSKGAQTARILLYKMFYDQTDEGFTQFLLNLFRSFDTHGQPKSNLADLLETIHVVFRLMEKLQARGTLRVSRKSRKGRRKGIKEISEVESERLGGEDAIQQNVDDQIKESGKSTSATSLDTTNIKENTSEKSIFDEEGTLTSNKTIDLDIPLEVTGCRTDAPSIMEGAKLNNNHNDQMYETDDSSDHEQLPATSEVDFNVSKLVSGFANNAVIQNLCWLLKYYKSNPASTNHYIICMLRRFCDDLELSPALYQLSLLTTFYDILADKSSSKSKEHANVVHFLTRFIRKMLKLMKSQPLLFVEILFWKTRRECRYINAEALMSDLAHLKKDIKSLDNEEVGMSNYKGQPGYKSIADSLGDDEVDYVVPNTFSKRREENSFHQDDMENSKGSGCKDNDIEPFSNDEMDADKSESIPDDLRKNSSKRKKGHIFDEEQVTTIKHLYEKYKDNRRCSHLIAEALDPDGNISPVQVSCKLKQLGLKVVSRRKLAHSVVSFPTGDNADEGVHDTIISNVTNNSLKKTDDDSYLKASSRTRKRVCAFSKEKELEVRALFEQFKNHKKCSHMIANALDADNAFTAAQVTRKLRQLGLLDPQIKRSSKIVKHSGEMRNKETSDREDKSDEETLLAIKERNKRKKSNLPTTTDISEHPLGHGSDDEILSSLFSGVLKQQHKKLYPNHEGGHGTVESATLGDNIEPQMDITSNIEDDGGSAILQPQEQRAVDEMMVNLEDSGDDLVPMVSVTMGSRRKGKMIIDGEDEE